MVAFQSVFHSEKYANNIFLFFKNYFWDHITSKQKKKKKIQIFWKVLSNSNAKHPLKWILVFIVKKKLSSLFFIIFDTPLPNKVLFISPILSCFFYLFLLCFKIIAKCFLRCTLLDESFMDMLWIIIFFLFIYYTKSLNHYII